MINFKIHDFGILAGSMLFYVAAYGQTSTKNYIRTAVPMQPYTTPAALNTAMSDHTKVRVDIDYYDGLGRPLQGVSSKAAPAAVDLVKPIAYDALGRQDKDYMPYPAGAGNSFRTNAVTAQQTYYSGTAPAGQPTTSKAYAATVYDGSPLDRVKERGFPGEVWQPAGSRTALAGRTVVIGIFDNNTEAYTAVATMRRATRWTATLSASGVPTLVNEGIYGNAQLAVTVTRNENWGGGSGTFASRIHTVEEYTDKLGRTVLRRTFNGTNEVLSTYYVYDNRGNLAFVLPPEINPDRDSGAPSAGELGLWAYQYRYDKWGRLAYKLPPSRGTWETYNYNRSGRLVLHQDSRQVLETYPGFSPGQYHTFYKYDAQGRLVIRGVERNRSMTRDEIEGILNSWVHQWENRSTAIGNMHGYTNNCIPQDAGDVDVLEVNYYDDYSGIPGLPHNQSASYSKLTRGLLVASKVKVLGTPSTYLWTVNYYDDEGRLVRQWKQHYLGGTSNANKFDDITNDYDFNGQLTKSTRKHHTTSVATPEVKVVTEHTYDHRGRVLDTKKSVNDAAATIISRNAYNEVGLLRTKRLHSTNGTNWGQQATYSYNTRGWMTTVDAPLFKQVLGYNAGTVPQYNGNITSQAFTRHDLASTPALVTDTYTYTYDGAERLTQGAMAGNKGRETMTYTKNGNIKTLVRTGTSSTVIDSLTYLYTGNRVATVDDLASSTDGNYQLPGPTYYMFDVNGNMKMRINSTSTGNNITTVTYNYLNLPESVTVPAGNITYTYDGTGRKLRSVGGIVGQTRDYIDGIEYVGGTMELIHHQEGRIIRSGTIYTYHYFLKDHQQNNRVGFVQGTNVTTPNFTADFYPFGLQYRQYIRTGSPKNNYLYTGKEFQDGLKLYDFGSRFYNAAAGRWGVPDPAEQFVNPYLALGNSPVNGIDPDGEFFEIFGLINLFTNKKAGHVDGFWSGVKAYSAGFISAALRPGATLAKATLATSVVHVNSYLGIFNGWKKVDMTHKLAAGLFHYDNNQSLAKQVEHSFARGAEGLQVFGGYAYSQFNVTMGNADLVDYFGGATFTIQENSRGWGVSLGNYINAGISDKYRGVPGDPLLMHEYGHTFDSRRQGPGYIPFIGLPSISSAKKSVLDSATGGSTHDTFWSERRANRFAAKYFQKYYGIDWSIYEIPYNEDGYYPR